MLKLLEIANAIEADHAGRVSVGAINHAFLSAGGNAGEYRSAMHRAVADGWLEAHPSGAYVKLKRKGCGQVRVVNARCKVLSSLAPAQ